MNPEPRTSLRSTRIWLTGASSGIGAALVTKLFERGARVAITARRTDLLDALAAGRGSRLLVVPADVTDAAAVAAAARRIESE
jgi:NADP-dependent 3-hydroxy acid dehydrogenase YdfG